MQTLSQIESCHRVNSSVLNTVKKASIHNNNSKVNALQYNGCSGRRTKDYEIDFEFKYVPEAELQAVVKRVRRARQKKEDEEIWLNFLRWKQMEVVKELSENNVCPECRPSVCEVDFGTECDFTHAQDGKEMAKMEGDDVQGSLINSTSIADNIHHAYQLGGVLSKRLQDLVATVSRMTSLLLSSVTTRSAQYEDEDVDRAIKRSIEFDAMFARNHLYEIQRLLKDAKQLAAGKSPLDEVETKISAALKCVMQAIQVYAKHVSKGARVKYQQVVPIFQSISTILGLLEQLTGQRSFPFRQELEVSCSYMKQVLLEMSTTDTQSVATVSRAPARCKPAARHKPSADLSMYNRRRADWRRKTATLARAKFGPPSGKKNRNKTDGVPETKNLDKNVVDFNENNPQHLSFKVTDKIISQVKEPSEAKCTLYRNATRAVPEDNVTTMMQMIPNEKSPTTNKPASARSVKGEPSNVQLVCLKEEDAIQAITSETKKDGYAILTIDDQTKSEALAYHQRISDYHKMNSHYKDGKALGIVDRLATRILTEMVLDFQKDEMNNVIQTLYNLEFE